MKKAVILLIIIIFPIFSCTKEDLPHVCATCIEKTTGYVPDDFCGRRANVEKYVETLKADGALYGQEWECVIE